MQDAGYGDCRVEWEKRDDNDCYGDDARYPCALLFDDIGFAFPPNFDLGPDRQSDKP